MCHCTSIMGFFAVWTGLNLTRTIFTLTYLIVQMPLFVFLLYIILFILPFAVSKMQLNLDTNDDQ